MATDIGDVVLCYVNERPSFFARIEDINPDVKPGWWQLTMLILDVPLRTIVWTLRDAYVQGETYTMGGVPHRLEKVVAPKAVPPPPPGYEPPDLPPPESGSGNKSDSGSKGQVISLADRRKK